MSSAGENPERLKKALNYKNPGEFGRMNIVWDVASSRTRHRPSTVPVYWWSNLRVGIEIEIEKHNINITWMAFGSRLLSRNVSARAGDERSLRGRALTCLSSSHRLAVTPGRKTLHNMASVTKSICAPSVRQQISRVTRSKCIQFEKEPKIRTSNEM